MAITPSRAGDAIAATCWNNIFRRENRVVIKENIKNAWNSREFRFQRKLISQGDWSCCKGANCACDPFGRESKFLGAPEVKSAIAGKKESLDYGPKLIVIIPSHDCNCDCHSCFQARIKSNRNKYSLRDGLLREIEATIIASAEYVIVSGGEPFFAEQSRGFIDRIVSGYPGKHVAVNTNGSLLHEYGLDRIMKNNLFLTISLYGMNADTCRAVTQRDYFDIVLRNLQTLIDRRYQNIKVSFLVTEKSCGDAEKFCEFIAGVGWLNGLVRNNWYEGDRFWGLMRRLEEKHADISSRLRFEYQSEPLLKVICRKWYNPVYSLRYLLG